MNLVEMINKLDINADWIGLREYKENIQYKCIRSKAELEKNIDGSISIKALILE